MNELFLEGSYTLSPKEKAIEDLKNGLSYATACLYGSRLAKEDMAALFPHLLKRPAPDRLRLTPWEHRLAFMAGHRFQRIMYDASDELDRFYAQDEVNMVPGLSGQLSFLAGKGKAFIERLFTSPQEKV